MTKVIFIREKNSIEKVIISGHALYAKFGNDIVCASISTLTQSIINGMIYVVGEEKKFYKLDKNIGKIEIAFPEVDNQAEKLKIEVLFDTLYINMKILSSKYSNYIDFEVKEEE